MMDAKEIIALIGDRLKTMARSNAIASQPISIGNRHVLPLCKLKLSFGGGGGGSEGSSEEGQNNQGMGSGVGGSAKIVPVAVVVVDGDDVRIESFGKKDLV
jgi:uncharacterized spore protein YtfJ